MRLDILDVVTFMRPCARLTVRRNDEAEKVARAVLQLGLAIIVGSFFRRHPINPRNGYVDGFVIDELQNTEEMICLYISPNKAMAEEARRADEDGNDSTLGRLLGYPVCCSDWVTSRGAVPAIAEMFSLYAGNGTYDALNWPGALVLDAALTVHYACHRDCCASRKQVAQRWHYISGSSCEALIGRIERAHRLTYWLLEPNSIAATDGEPQIPFNAIAKPLGGLRANG